jgi:hypothetical protein
MLVNYIEVKIFKISNIVITAMPGGHAVITLDKVVGKKLSACICG